MPFIAKTGERVPPVFGAGRSPCWKPNMAVAVMRITKPVRDFMDSPSAIARTAQEYLYPSIFQACLPVPRQSDQDFCGRRYSRPPRTAKQEFLQLLPTKIKPDVRAAPRT